jgi:DNA-binding MarR family transcriptional regulator
MGDMAMSEWETATAVLRLSAQLVDGIQAGAVGAGFDDVRPVHGFVFAIVSSGPTTAGAVAEELGVTKQAAAQLVDYLERRGYLRRRRDPYDKRARILELTERGIACTHAAERAAAAVVAQWRSALSSTVNTDFEHALATLARPGKLRPAW